MIHAEIDGKMIPFADERSLEMYQTLVHGKKSESCGRVRTLRKREAALKFYFKLIIQGRDMWHRITEIYEKAPQLTERVASDMGVTELKIKKGNDHE